MLYWIPAFEFMITLEELDKARNANRLQRGEWTEITESDWKSIIDNRIRVNSSSDMILNDVDDNRPYIGFEPTTETDKHMALRWLIDGMTPDSYHCRRKALLKEIRQREAELEEKEYHLNQFYRILGHTVIDQDNYGDFSAYPINQGFSDMIRNRENVVSLLIRYLRDLYKAMYEEIDESICITDYMN